MNVTHETVVLPAVPSLGLKREAQKTSEGLPPILGEDMGHAGHGKIPGLWSEDLSTLCAHHWYAAGVPVVFDPKGPGIAGSAWGTDRAEIEAELSSEEEQRERDAMVPGLAVTALAGQYDHHKVAIVALRALHPNWTNNRIAAFLGLQYPKGSGGLKSPIKPGKPLTEDAVKKTIQRAQKDWARLYRILSPRAYGYSEGSR